MTESNLVILLIILPLAGSVFGLAAKILHGNKYEALLEWAGIIIGLIVPLSLLAVLLPAAREGTLVFSVGGQGYILGILQHFDGMAWCLDAMIYVSMLTAWLFTRGAGPKGGLFTSVLLILTAALVTAASCRDLFNLFVCFELIGICSYVLVAVSEKPKALFASLNYLIISSASMVFFLAGIFGIYRLTGLLSFDGIYDYLKTAPLHNSRQILLSIVALTAATLVRIAVIPVASWLPGAHGAAPHGVSAILSGVVLKVPLFALGRLLMMYTRADLLLPLSGLWRFLGLIGITTAFAGVLGALVQRDAKKLLAWHSVSQIGYIVSAWSLGSPTGFAAAFLYSLFHSLFKSLLFVTVGTATDTAGSRNVYAVRNLRRSVVRSGDKYGITFICFVIAALSIAAVPPFTGFAGKNAVTVLFKGNPLHYWTLVITGIGTIASMIKLGIIFFDVKPFETIPGASAGADIKISMSMKLSMIIWGLACTAGGIFIYPLSRFTAGLFHSGTEIVPRNLYSPGPLLHLAVYLILGTGLFYFLRSKTGMKLSHSAAALPKDFSFQVFGFSVLMAAMALAVLGTIR